MTYTINFNQLSLKDLSVVGGKNASLGELYQQLRPEGILIPDGFAVTAAAYWEFLQQNQLKTQIEQIVAKLDTQTFNNLEEIGQRIRTLILRQPLPSKLRETILIAFRALQERTTPHLHVAVRSSATAEDLPTASFAGQQESYLNISTERDLLEACVKCYASLYTSRAIKYRIEQGFKHEEVALSIGIQQMVRSDRACAGVCFTIDPETGFKDAIVINGAWGLGENVVKGKVEPDEFVLYKPALHCNKPCFLSKKLGRKEWTLEYCETPGVDFTTINKNTSPAKALQWVLDEDEIYTLGRWALRIEEHYQLPMDIEWAKDGIDGQLYIVQARPETVHANRKNANFTVYRLTQRGKIIAQGAALGNRITSGRARVLNNPTEAGKLQKGEVLVTHTTDPDWDPILKKAAAIITDTGGRTSHAAIVARELGAVAIVGAENATKNITDGQLVTVSCAEGTTGYVYEGQLTWEEQTLDPATFTVPKTNTMLILADPDQAFQYAALPTAGVGLLRMEFIISNAIQIHPMALARFNQLTDQKAKSIIRALTAGYTRKVDYFVDKLGQSIATVAAAFAPREVIVRLSDFKSNEYANLIGGRQFEPHEKNPMLGFRGASRYYHELYRDAFRLECKAIKRVRDEMGLTNVKVMIPFCRSINEAERVLAIMDKYGLTRGRNGLEIYVMVELPVNVLLATSFAQRFDGFSIGSNDLTQLTLGIDRDNALISSLFNENELAVRELIRQTIAAARKQGIPVGLCGQAPSDFPSFTRFLVEEGITSIAFTPDALLTGLKHINLAEAKKIKPMVI